MRLIAKSGIDLEVDAVRTDRVTLGRSIAVPPSGS